MEKSINFSELCCHGDLSCFFKKMPNSKKCLLHSTEDKEKLFLSDKKSLIENIILKLCGNRYC